MIILDELEKLSKEATAGKWEYDDGVVYAQNEPPTQYEIPRLFIGKHVVEVQNLRDSDSELIVLMRNNIDALIAVARAAEVVVEEIRIRPFNPDTWVLSSLKESLEKLK